MKKLPLPDALEPYRAILETTQKEYIRISLQKEETALTQSKFGGFPYFPKTQEYPLDEHGMPMFLLAQINFEEMPAIEPYPTRGILQFYISYEDDVYGMDFDDSTNQQNFRVLYHEHLLPLEELMQDFSFLPQSHEDTLPFIGEKRIVFERNEEFVSLSDYQYTEKIGEQLDLEQAVNGQELWDVYSETIHSAGHKIGGYAFFTQCDPREDDNTYGQHRHLLLQIDSDDEQNIIWGDVGVANFFITEEDLKNKQFEKVLYTWDCH